MTTPAATPRPWSAKELLLVLLGWLAVASVFAVVAGSTQGTYDTYRDLWFAAGIVEGLEFPLNGPGINQTFHLGPVWYYILAAALLVMPPTHAAVALTALAVAARFPLAYAAGRSLGGRRAGIWALALMAIPGWWLLALGVVTHTAATEAAVLWLILATAGVVRGATQVRLSWVGLAAAAAIHAHPTTATLAAISAIVALLNTPRGSRRGAAVCLVLPTLLLLSPYLLGGGLAEDLSDIGTYARSLADDPKLIRFLQLPFAMLLGGPLHATWIWGGVEHSFALLLACVPWAVAGASVVSALMRTDVARERRIAALLAAAFLLQCLLLVLSRPVTPPWMVFSLTPLLALSAAQMAAAGFAATPWLRRLCLAAVIVLAALGSTSALVGLTAPARGSTSWWPRYPQGSPGPMSVTELPIGRDPAAPPLASLASSDELLPTGCSPLQLHGELALLADRSLGYPWRLACGATNHVHLGGAPVPGATQLFKVWHPAVLAHCAASDDPRGTEPGTFVVHTGAPPLAFGDPAQYPPRSVAGPPVVERFTVSASEPLLFVGTLLPAYAPIRLQRAAVGGAEPRVIASTGGYAVLACQSGCATGVSHRWEIEVAALPGTLDVVAFSCPAGAGP